MHDNASSPLPFLSLLPIEMLTFVCIRQFKSFFPSVPHSEYLLAKVPF